jgi:hypothetical protein
MLKRSGLISRDDRKAQREKTQERSKRIDVRTRKFSLKKDDTGLTDVLL